MGFKQFTESNKQLSPDDGPLDLIAKDCKPFLKDGVILYRGMKFSNKGKYGIQSVRQNRRPSDSSKEFHEFMELHLKTIGAPSREKSVFCTREATGTWDYGETYMIFPRGKFSSFYFTGLEDAYTDIESALHMSVFTPKKVFEGPVELPRELEDTLTNVSERYKKTKDLEDAVHDYIDDCIKFVESQQLPEDYEEDYLSDLEDARHAVQRVFKKLEFYEMNNLKGAEDQEIILQCKDYYYIEANNENIGLVKKKFRLKS